MGKHGAGSAGALLYLGLCVSLTPVSFWVGRCHTESEMAHWTSLLLPASLSALSHLFFFVALLCHFSPSPQPPPSILSKSLSCVHPFLFFSFSPYFFFFYLYRFLHAKIALCAAPSASCFLRLFFISFLPLPPGFTTSTTIFHSVFWLCFPPSKSVSTDPPPPLPLLHPYLWEQTIDVIDCVSQVMAWLLPSYKESWDRRYLLN